MQCKRESIRQKSKVKNLRNISSTRNSAKLLMLTRTAGGLGWPRLLRIWRRSGQNCFFLLSNSDEDITRFSDATVQVVSEERLERGGPAECWNWGEWGLKEYKWNWSFPWLVCWTRRAGTIDFCPALAALVSPVQNIALFHFISAHCPATCMGRQACWVACLCVSEFDEHRQKPPKM